MRNFITPGTIVFSLDKEGDTTVPVPELPPMTEHLPWGIWVIAQQGTYPALPVRTHTHTPVFF